MYVYVFVYISMKTFYICTSSYMYFASIAKVMWYGFLFVRIRQANYFKCMPILVGMGIGYFDENLK